MNPPTILVQLSDPHIVERGRLLLDRIDTAALLAQAVAAIQAMPVPATAVVLTGDLADGGAEPQYHHLRELLAPLVCPWYLMPGNHDDRDTLVVGAPHGELCERRLAWLDAMLCEAPLTPHCRGPASPAVFDRYRPHGRDGAARRGAGTRSPGAAPPAGRRPDLRPPAPQHPGPLRRPAGFACRAQHRCRAATAVLSRRLRDDDRRADHTARRLIFTPSTTVLGG